MEKISHDRRNFLKFIFIAVTAFVLGKLFNPLKNLVMGEKVIEEVDFQNFKYRETTKSFSFMDKEGDPIIIVEKDDF